MVSGNSFTERHPLLQEARWLYEQVAAGASVLNAELAECMFGTLSEWRCPEPVLAAALLLPVLEAGLPVDRVGDLSPSGAVAVQLAESARAWRVRLTISPDEAGLSRAEQSLLLRSLYRQAYLDAPNQYLLLLLLAEFSWHLRGEAQLTVPAAQLTISVLVPLAQMLGVWRLRRAWLERAMAALEPRGCAELARELGDPALYRRELWHASRGEDLRSRLQGNARLAAKAEVYCQIEERLVEGFDAALVGRPPLLYPIPIYPGVSRRREQFGESRERITRWLRIRVVCETEADCYRALGAIHRLGEPAAFQFAYHFSDYLAAPKPNGYRAVHTAIHYRRPPRANLVGGMPVEFRIVTPRCHLINEWGVIAAVHRRPVATAAGGGQCWWERPDLGETRARLAQDIGSRADAGKVYSFTPHGDVRLLPDGSTALDFAYSIHSELGNHARKININGESALFGDRLRNGDLVEVEYDPRSPGPDPTWVALVTTDRAAEVIRQEVNRRAGSLSPARADIQKALHQVQRWYRQKRQRELTISNVRLDALLLMVAQNRGLADLAGLYSEVGSGAVPVATVVEEVIAAELIPLLLTPTDQPPDWPSGAIRLCGSCRPMPGDRIVGLSSRRTVSQRLTVHREDSGCLRAAADRRVSLQWAAERREREQMVLLLDADERAGLLGNLLQLVYAQPGVSVQKVTAEARGETGAGVTMLLEVDALDSLGQIRGRLEQLEGVRHIAFLPPSPAEQFRPRPQPTNPYRLDDDLDRSMFYDREDLLERLTAGVRNDGRACRLVLSGPKRVGKTSLAKYFVRYVFLPQRLGVAVYVNLHGLTQFNTGAMVDFLQGKVLAALGWPRLPVGESLNPLERMNEFLAAAAGTLKRGQRLLLILDEINFFLDLPPDRFNPTAVDNLHYLITSRSEVCWLVIAQPRGRIDASRAAQMNRLLIEFSRLEVGHLEPGWAEKLIHEPVRRCGMRYAEEPCNSSADEARRPLPAELTQLTDGHPYLIQRCCHSLVEDARQRQQTTITPTDLTRVVARLVADKEDPYFDAATRELPDIQLALVTLVAQGEAAGVAQMWLREKVRRLHPQAGEVLVERAMDALVREGVLAAEGAEGRLTIRIRMGLLRRWARVHLSGTATHSGAE